MEILCLSCKHGSQRNIYCDRLPTGNIAVLGVRCQAASNPCALRAVRTKCDKHERVEA
ncbi:MAG TPA: hypothetical protein O0X25_01770 [Methanocorpusculum sp.]|nr:hypothetical protein [Methanocorpusculum sp.]HJJ39725.1 hypothetical protein [Methanocorpusculum sp.]HJJ49334.1 hypothetical protein [Methanocorpusculum sp.]HJJ56622.1 hypothetical protein [Methanocorpusculum sp.]